jgi:hypothetical protein
MRHTNTLRGNTVRQWARGDSSRQSDTQSVAESQSVDQDRSVDRSVNALKLTQRVSGNSGHTASEALVPSWRLREETGRRRELEAQVRAFKIALVALGCNPDEILATLKAS